jgi:hypothetical protein
MEWAVWIFIAVMLGLYVWSHATAGHQIGQKLQPFIDKLFGVAPSQSEREKPTKPKTD